MLKAMNPQSYAYKVISEGFEVSNSEYHSVFIIPKIVTLICVYSYGKHVCTFDSSQVLPILLISVPALPPM